MTREKKFKRSKSSLYILIRSQTKPDGKLNRQICYVEHQKSHNSPKIGNPDSYGQTGLAHDPPDNPIAKGEI